MNENIYSFTIYYFLPVLFVVFYAIYSRKFKFFTLIEKFDESLVRNKLARGKCPPAYPNGWYRLCRSNELKPGQVQEIKIASRHIAFFRGLDNVVYAVHAYCPHMGANLGKGGKVKYQRCIECPFHGWTVDGKTGKVVVGETYEPKRVTKFEYCEVTEMKQEDGKYIKEIGEGEASVDRYEVKEHDGLVFIWLHCLPEFKNKPYYEPIRANLRNLSLRAESVNYVRCHIQEIPENGADIRHFDFLHESVISIFTFMKFKWTMKSKPPLDKDFHETMTHPNPKVRSYQNELYEMILKGDSSRLKYMNVVSLDADIVFFERWKFYFMTATAFQVGPATVSLYLKTHLFEALYQQAIQPIDRFTQKVYHTAWTSSFLPYWASAYVLHGELRQVLFDGKIWNNKIFSDNLAYNLQSEADKALLKWRQWYGQFYEGSGEFQKQLDNLEW